jgi:putative ABC transport system permease protein
MTVALVFDGGAALNPVKLFDDLRREAVHAVRAFGRQPGFAAIIVMTLALGIGVNAATFSLFEQLLLRPLPVDYPGGLVNLVSPGDKFGRRSCNSAGDCDYVLSYPMFRDLERLQEPFVGIAGHRSIDAYIVLGERAVTGHAMLVSGAYFRLLGVSPALGRLLGPQDDAVDGEASTVVLNYVTWREAPREDA